MLKQGDCLQLMTSLHDETIDLVYLDPPFFTQRRHSLNSKSGVKFEFDDSWKDREEYLIFMSDRLKAARRVLKSTGSIFVHCDTTSSHHLRILLDDIFGINMFRSEIIWTYKRWSNAKKGLLNSHQTILFYSKTANFKFNHLYEDYSSTTNLDQIFQLRIRENNGKTRYKTDKDGTSELAKSKKGVPLSDVWDIPYLNPKARERVGYPTQKPILLLERVIKLATDEDDIVLDPFCGSGTTCVAAKLLGRRYLGFDTSPNAIALAEARIANPIRSQSKVLSAGRQSYKVLTSQRRLQLEELNVQPVERNSGIDGFAKNGSEILPIPVKIHQRGELLNNVEEKLLRAAQRNHFANVILVSEEISGSEIRLIGSVNLYVCGFTVYANTLESILKS